MPAFISQIIEQHPDAGYWHQQYPWFSIGQLVNAANTKDTPGFTQSSQMAAVFFNDIPRLHWLLHQQDVNVEAIKTFINPHPEAVVTQPHTNATQPPATKETEAIALHEKETEQDIDAVETVNEIPGETNKGTSKEDDVAIDKDKKEEVAISQPVASADAIQQASLDEIPVKQIVGDTSNQLVEENLTDSALTEANISAPLAENVSGELTATDDTGISKIEEPEATIDDEEQEIEETELIPLSTEMLSESLAQAADDFKNTPVDEEALVFKTAYQHTIDYFASQGIKLDVEPAKDDRFGQQLKTFTSWLRHMKRLPDAPVPEADPLVESHAAHSLQTGEVLTEPMADVLLKQGKHSQAIAVLEKLRLLHPSKSHYFAARIQQIKHS